MGVYLPAVTQLTHEAMSIPPERPLSPDGTRTPTGDLTIGAHSLLVTQQGSNPPTPASSHWRAFFKSDGLYVIDSAGTVTGPLAGAGGFPELLISGGLLSLGSWNTTVHVYGRATAPANARPGAYTDTVTVRIDY